MRRILVWGLELLMYYVLWLVLVKPMVAYYMLLAQQMSDMMTFYGN